MLSKFNEEKMYQNESISTFYKGFKLRYEACKSHKVPGFQDESSAVHHFYSKVDAQRYSALHREKVNLVNRNIDHWPTALLGAYSEVEKWKSQRLADNSVQRPTTFTVAGPVDMATQFHCHTCGKLGPWMADCPHNKSCKPSVSINASD